MSSSRILTFSELMVTIQSVLDELKNEHNKASDVKRSYSYDEFWPQISGCFQNVSTQTTKLTVLYSQPPFPEEKELNPLMTNIEMSLLGLVSTFYTLPVSEGQILHKAVCKTVIGVVEAVLDLLQCLQLKQTSESSKRHLQTTGTVWELCDCAAKLPKDNVQAVLVHINEAHELISDALSELEEAERNEIGDDFDEFMFDGGPERGEVESEQASWSDSDRLVVAAGIGLVKTAKATMKKISKAVSSSGKCITAESISQLDNLMEYVSVVSPAVDDFALSLYPPVKLQTVQSNSETLEKAIRKLLQYVRESHFTSESDASWLDFLVNAVDHNSSKVNSLICSTTTSP